MDFFPVDSLSIKTADILSRYYSSVSRLQEHIEAEHVPETNSETTAAGPTGPTFKRHKIFDPIRNKNILVPNKRLYDPNKIPKVHCSNDMPWQSQTGIFTVNLSSQIVERHFEPGWTSRDVQLPFLFFFDLVNLTLLLNISSPLRYLYLESIISSPKGQDDKNSRGFCYSAVSGSLTCYSVTVTTVITIIQSVSYQATTTTSRD